MKSNSSNDSFVFSLIALNAKTTKTINSFDEKDANERVDERTRERESAYELKEEKTYKMMMMMKRDQANKEKETKKKSKNEK
jgi:hypothetical protein